MHGKEGLSPYLMLRVGSMNVIQIIMNRYDARDMLVLLVFLRYMNPKNNNEFVSLGGC